MHKRTKVLLLTPSRVRLFGNAATTISALARTTLGHFNRSARLQHAAVTTRHTSKDNNTRSFTGPAHCNTAVTIGTSKNNPNHCDHSDVPYAHGNNPRATTFRTLTANDPGLTTFRTRTANVPRAMTDLLQNPQRAIEPTTTSDEESPANRATCRTGPRLWCRTRDPGLSFEPSSPSDFEPRFPNGYGERASRGGSLWMRTDPLIILSRTTVYKRWKCILDPFGPTLSRTPPGQLCTRCCPLTVTSFLAETRVNFTVPRASISSLSK